VSRLFPALAFRTSPPLDADELGRLLAALDDLRPTAIDETPDHFRIFFNTAADRDRGLDTVQHWPGLIDAHPVDLPDDNWAARSQAALGAVRVGRVWIAPPWDPLVATHEDAESALVIIQPSMGFGTGHHATTRLCLALLQRVPLTGGSVMDVGTGSGVLALAAWKLGAARVIGIDVDEDALTSARENVDLNSAGAMVDLRRLEITHDRALIDAVFDVVTANLTGSMIERAASTLATLVKPGGQVITSGFQAEDEPGVLAALAAAGLRPHARVEEAGWVATACARVEA
jgi:ribosomal protein L11 methyltransferase